jgi:AraC-like DNA-binding protein
VERLWHSDGTAAREGAFTPRERALPNGSMDLVFRLAGAPIRIFADLADPLGQVFGHAVVSGVRSSYCVRDTRVPSCAVGAHFQPGGAAALLGVPADDLAERHTALVDLWGSAAERAREHLLALRSPGARLDALEQLLLARLSGARAPHPAVRLALARFDDARAVPPIGEVCREAGTSHRRLIEVFRRSVGLTPKVYCRVRRFQRAIERAARGGPEARPVRWAELAAACGLYDQSHLQREFLAFAGMTPGAYRPISADRPNHVPLWGEPVGSIPYKTAARGSA